MDCDHSRILPRHRSQGRLSRTDTFPQPLHPRFRRRRWPASCRRSRWWRALRRLPSAAGPRANRASVDRAVRATTSPSDGRFLRRCPPCAPLCRPHRWAWAVCRTRAPRKDGMLAAPPQSRPLHACTVRPCLHTSCSRPWPQRGAASSAALGVSPVSTHTSSGGPPRVGVCEFFAGSRSPRLQRWASQRALAMLQAKSREAEQRIQLRRCGCHRM
jgi:hypothetical protein